MSQKYSLPKKCRDSDTYVSFCREMRKYVIEIELWIDPTKTLRSSIQLFVLSFNYISSFCFSNSNFTI